MNCVDWSDVASAAEELAGNHGDFESFAWHERPDDAQDWAIVYTHNRDSGLLDQCNAAAIAAELEPFMEGEHASVRAEHHGHWAVGWVDGYAIRVFDPHGAITDGFRAWCRIQERLADYPVLDEEDYSRREYEAGLEAIQQEGGRCVKEDAPEDWPAQVYTWLSQNDGDWPHELESRDDQGAYPSEAAIRAALMDLELLDAMYSVVVGDRPFLETTSLSKARKEFDTLAYHAGIGIGLAHEQRVGLWCDDEILDQYPEE